MEMIRKTKEQWLEFSLKEFKERTGVDASDNKDSMIYKGLEMSSSLAFDYQEELIKLSKESEHK